MSSPAWFIIQSGPNAGRWHMQGWRMSAIKGEDLSLLQGAKDPTQGWLSYAHCPRCHAMVGIETHSPYGDQQWAHEDWHAETDYPHPS